MFFEWICDCLDKLEAAEAKKEFQAKEKALKDDGYVFICTNDYKYSADFHTRRLNKWYGFDIYTTISGRIYAHKLRLKQYVDFAVRSQDVRRTRGALALPIREVLGDDVYNNVIAIHRDLRLKETRRIQEEHDYIMKFNIY